MFKITKREKREYKKDDGKEAPRLTEPGVYVAQLVKVALKKSREHPDWTPGISFIFRVVQEPVVGGFASGIVSSNWTPGNKLDEWLTALGVEGSEIGDDLVVDQLRGQLARINVEITQDGFAKVINVYEMRDVDHEKVVESALYKKRDKSVQQDETSETVSVSRRETKPRTVDQEPVSNEGSVTQDDSIPF